MLTATTLPSHCRNVPMMRELVDADPSAVIAAMDLAGDDIASGSAAILVDIDAVGIQRKDITIAIRDPFGSGTDARAVCTIDLAAKVPAANRGLHLSRIGDVMARSVEREYVDVADYARSLASETAASQYGAASVTVWARIPYLETLSTAARREKRSLEHLNVMARANVAPDRTTTDLGIRINHIVACPCVQMTYYHSLAQATGRGRASAIRHPLLTHSQRCITTVVVEDVRPAWSIADVLRALDDVLIRTCNTLPRDLELAFVYRAHQNPQFIEDAVRLAVAAVSRTLHGSATFASISGRSRSIESIHEFDLKASIVLDSAQCEQLRY